MTDYTNPLTFTSTPSHIKWAITLLIIINMIIYKKFKISRYIEEAFPNYPLTYGSLGFLIFITFLFATYGVDIFIEIFCTVLGVLMALSYLTNVYEDAENKKLGKKWIYVGGIILINLALFKYIEDKKIVYIISLTLNAICMIYESKKSQALKEHNI